MHYIDLYGENIFGPGWGLNGRLTDSETCTLPTTLLKQGKILPGKIVMQFLFWHSTNDGDVKSIFTSLTNQKYNASAGNRTRVNCLEGSYAHHYTTDACFTILLCTPKWKPQIHICLVTSTLKEKQRAIKLFTLCNKFPWCSGYHICLTRRRSPVRSRTETESHVV